jgi:hypothetical protein
MALAVVVGPKPAASTKMPTSTPTMAKLWAAVAASHLVRDRPEDLEIVCKAFPVRNGPRVRQGRLHAGRIEIAGL